MSQTKIRIINEFLVTQMNNLIFYPFAMTLSTMFYMFFPVEHPSMAVWMIGGLLPFGYFFCRRYVNHFVPLVLLHLVGVAIHFGLAFLLTPSKTLISIIYYMLIQIIFTIVSLYSRLTVDEFSKIDYFDDKPIMVLFSIGFNAIALLIQNLLGNDQWNIYYKISIILILVYYFIGKYLQEYLTFLIVNASSTGVLPEKQIFRSGFAQISFFTITTGVILMCTSNFVWLRKLLDILKIVIYYILRFFIRLSSEEETSEVLIPEETVGSGSPDGAYVYEPGEPALFWQIMEVVALVAIIAAILYALFRSLKALYAYINKIMQKHATKYAADSENPVIFDVREKCEINKKREGRNSALEFFGFLDSGERIRRIYKKAASSYKPNPLLAKNSKSDHNFSEDKLSFYTAREMEHYMKSGEFAEIYEKARYSNELCTSQDVKRMKDACK